MRHHRLSQRLSNVDAVSEKTPSLFRVLNFHGEVVGAHFRMSKAVKTRLETFANSRNIELDIFSVKYIVSISVILLNLNCFFEKLFNF